MALYELACASFATMHPHKPFVALLQLDEISAKLSTSRRSVRDIFFSPRFSALIFWGSASPS